MFKRLARLFARQPAEVPPDDRPQYFRRDWAGYGTANRRRQIIDAMQSWTLASAVGAANGSIGSEIGFDSWLGISRRNWMPGVRDKTSAQEHEIEEALRDFVNRNAAKSYGVVLCELAQARGEPIPLVIPPGGEIGVVAHVPVVSETRLFTRCLHCASQHFLAGPAGGAGQNVECEGCGARFLVFRTPWGGPFLDRQIGPPDPERLRVRLEVEAGAGRGE